MLPGKAFSNPSQRALQEFHSDLQLWILLQAANPTTTGHPTIPQASGDSCETPQNHAEPHFPLENPEGVGFSTTFC